MNLYRHHFESDHDFTRYLSDLAAGCDLEFDNYHDEIEREFAELLFANSSKEANHG